MTTKLGAELERTDPAAPARPATNKELIKVEVERYRDAVAKSLPAGYGGGVDRVDSAERFTRSVLNAIMVDKSGQLAKCTPLSIVGAALHAAQLGLEIGPLQEAYLVPYGNVCQFMAGYRGLIKLAAPEHDIEAQVVHEGDEFDYVYGTDSFLRHRPGRGQRGKAVEWWAMAKRRDGSGGRFVVVGEEYVAKRRAASKAKGTWDAWPEEMALKTAIRALMRTLPLSPHGQVLAIAAASDGVVRDSHTYLDAPPDAFAMDEDVAEAELLD